MDQVAQVREKIDIVALISEYIPVKKAGRNFKANCPFHGEKTPSFIISPDRQRWHCFGCSKDGDCFTFLMDYERLEFPEALRILAQKAGIELVQRNYDGATTSKKERLYEINRLVCEYYHYLLVSHTVGKKALMYLTDERQMLPQTIKTFMLGYAPVSGRDLVMYLTRKKNYSIDDLFDAGLVTRRGNEVVDFFHDRIMFPLFDARDNVVGFAGRVLTKDAVQAKYINTRETLIYHKGSTFFGLHMTREAIRKAKHVIILEGEFDVISSFQAGVSNVVAVKGTALTEDQVTLIHRYADRVSLCFDMDKAGQEATKRSLPILEKKGLQTTVVVVPEGKDADEAVKTNPVGFKRAVKDAIDVYEFLLELALKNFDKRTVEGKKMIGDELLPIFGGIENAIVKEHYLNKLSRELGISYESLQQEIERLAKRRVVRNDPVLPAVVSRSREEVMEEYLLGLLVQSPNPKRFIHRIFPMMTTYKFSHPAYQRLFDLLFVFVESRDIFDAKQFVFGMPSEIVPAFDVCYLLPLPKLADEDIYEAEILKVAEELHTFFVHKQIKALGDTIQEKEKKRLDDSEGTEELEKLEKDLGDLIGLLRKK